MSRKCQVTHFVVDFSHESSSKSKFKTHCAHLHANSDRQPNVTEESLTALNYVGFYNVGELCEKPIRILCLVIIPFKREANNGSFCAHTVGPLLYMQ